MALSQGFRVHVSTMQSQELGESVGLFWETCMCRMLFSPNRNGRQRDPREMRSSEKEAIGASQLVEGGGAV